MDTVQLGCDLVNHRGTGRNTVLTHALLQLPTQFLETFGTQCA